MIAKIIVDNKSKQVDKPFDYLVPKELEDKIKIGSRVLVPFSSGNREIEGFCVGTADTSDSKRLKSIIRTANDSIGFDEDMLELIEWMHKKYLASYLDIIHTIVPSGTALKTKEWIILENKSEEKSEIRRRITEILTDNGKDYKARDLSLEYPLSVMNVLGIGKITATPYHGQAKPVERFFRTLEERFGKMFYSYAGNDAKKRPEHMAKTIQKLEEDPNIPSMDFYIEQLERWIEEYNNTPHYGEGMDGQTPNSVYIQNLEKRVEVKDRNTLKLLCGKTVTRTVDRNGVRIFSQTYSNYDGCLVSYYDKKVMVTYDPDNIDSVFIFDMDYRYICMAESRLKPMFRNTNEEEFNKLAKEKKKVRELVKACRPVREKSIFELIAEHHQQEEMYRNQHEQIETEVLTTPFSEQADKAFEPKATDKSFEQRMIAYANTENEKEPETHEETGSEDINFENFMFNYIKNA